MARDYLKYRARLKEEQERLKRRIFVAQEGERPALETRLREVHAALDAIENLTYGFCSACGNEISTERLDADATSLVCASCLRLITEEVTGL